MSDWVCRYCGSRFTEYREYIKHIMDIHDKLKGAIHGKQ